MNKFKGTQQINWCFVCFLFDGNETISPGKVTNNLKSSQTHTVHQYHIYAIFADVYVCDVCMYVCMYVSAEDEEKQVIWVPMKTLTLTWMSSFNHNWGLHYLTQRMAMSTSLSGRMPNSLLVRYIAYIYTFDHTYP